MATTRLDIAIAQRGTFRLVVRVVNGPADITSYTGQMQIRQTKANAEVLGEATADMFTIDNATRTVTLQIPSEVTDTFDWDYDAVYDMYIVGPDEDEWRLVEGVAKLSKTVTRED